MQIAIDMQGALTSGSTQRGIGRYTLQLTKAIADQLGSRQLSFMLNGNFPDAKGRLLQEYPQDSSNIAFSVYSVPRSEGYHTLPSSPYRVVGDAIVRRHVADLRPDVVLFTSVFEVAPDDFVPLDLNCYPAAHTAVICYDLIPLLFDKLYLSDATAHRRYCATLEMLRKADLIFAISESCRRDIIAFLGLKPERVINISAASDEKFYPISLSEQEQIEIMAQLGLSRAFVMYVAGADPRKNHIGAIEVFAKLSPHVRKTHQLLLVSKMDVAYENLLRCRASELGVDHEDIVIARAVPDNILIKLLNFAQCFLFPSLYEGFGLPVLEAMQCGLSVVAADTSSIPEIIDRTDILFNPADSVQGAEILERVLTDADLRKELREWGISRAQSFSWSKSASLCLAALDQLAGSHNSSGQVAPCELLEIDGSCNEIDKVLAFNTELHKQKNEFLSDMIQSVSFFRNATSRRLLIDATDTCDSDAHTGIQRVVKRLIQEFYEIALDKNVTPVAVFMTENNLRTIPEFISSLLGKSAYSESYELTIKPGDDLLMLDSNWIRFSEYQKIYEKIRQVGGRVITCVYDLIPELHPECCINGMPEVHKKWLLAAIELSDALLCISRSVASELIKYIEMHELPHRPGLHIGWFHLGSNVSKGKIVKEAGYEASLCFSGDSPVFLTVGTLEPRKNQAEALAAFELLWAKGSDAKLCILGRKGWNIEQLASTISNHSLFGKKLFWLSDASDDDLVYAYEHATAVLCTSIAEGFGLPVIEALQMDCPVICSDIPVFREVGGEAAVYFPSGDPAALAQIIETWGGRHMIAAIDFPRPLSWGQSASRVIDILKYDDWFTTLGV